MQVNIGLKKLFIKIMKYLVKIYNYVQINRYKTRTQEYANFI
jgi:hypothetical protein